MLYYHDWLASTWSIHIDEAFSHVILWKKWLHKFWMHSVTQTAVIVMKLYLKLYPQTKLTIFGHSIAPLTKQDSQQGLGG